MIDKKIREKIEKRAYDIYKYRQENCIVGSHLDDWFQAECEIVTDRRGISGCPLCNSNLLVKEDNKIICLMCKWSVELKRKSDEKIPDFKEVKSRWE
jgi:hypothetical protein